jgi:RES domain-containing protein
MAADDLAQRIDRLKAARWSGTAYRHTAPEYPALSGSGAASIGGRWNPRGISTIYLAYPEAACVAEFRRMAEGQAGGVRSFLPRDLHTIEVTDLRVLDLTVAAARRALAIELTDIEDSDRARCQEVGEAAAYIGLQGVVAPSATRAGVVIAVFERNIRQGQLTLIATKPLDSVLDERL